MSSMQKSSRIGISVLFVLGVALLCASCGGDGEEEYEFGGLFDTRFQKVAVSPSTIAEGSSNTITWDIMPRFTGTGHVLIAGHGGGHPLGMITAPVVGELGEVIVPVDFVGGISARSTFTLLVTTDLAHVGISFQAIYDSVLVDGDMIATQVFAGRTSVTTFDIVTLDAAQHAM